MHQLKTSLLAQVHSYITQVNDCCFSRVQHFKRADKRVWFHGHTCTQSHLTTFSQALSMACGLEEKLRQAGSVNNKLLARVLSVNADWLSVSPCSCKTNPRLNASMYPYHIQTYLPFHIHMHGAHSNALIVFYFALTTCVHDSSISGFFTLRNW
jgi:hypothetical protein